MKGALREGFLLGNPKDILSKARKWASDPQGSHVWGSWMGASFLGNSY